MNLCKAKSFRRAWSMIHVFLFICPIRYVNARNAVHSKELDEWLSTRCD